MSSATIFAIAAACLSLHVVSADPAGRPGTVGQPVSESDVIIIGAGQAGMAAAHRLARLGRSVQVLEATGHVGGRTRNVDVRTGLFDVATDDVMEVGGTWLSPGHTTALALCKELGIEVFNASFVSAGSGSGSASSESQGRVGTDEAWPWWFWGSDYPAEQTPKLLPTVFHGARGRFLYRTPAELAKGLDNRTHHELSLAGAALDRALANVSDKCWTSEHVSPGWAKLDADSTMGALGREMSQPDARQTLRNCIHGKNAHEPEEVSFLYNLLSFKGCNSAGPDSQFRVRGGSQAIPLGIAKLMKSSVLLNTTVHSVQATTAGVCVRAEDGREFRASAAIVTGPPPTVLGLNFDPPLAGPQAQLLQRMPMGTSLKFAAVYKQGPWWRSAGLQGDILATSLPPELSMPEPDSGLPIFVQCMDHSPFSRQLGVIACFLEGRQNLHFTSLSPAEQQRLLLAFLRISFNDSRAETYQPTFVHHNWADQPFARGAYTGFFPPGVLSVSQYWTAYHQMEKVPNVFLAGGDYHVGFGNGYIEGAIRDGQDAATRVEQRLRKTPSGPTLSSRVV